MALKPLTINGGQIEQLASGQALDVGGWNLPTAGGTENYVLIADSSGHAVWSSTLVGLTNLTVDNININGAAITSDTGAISFDDEDLSTSGTLTSGQFSATYTTFPVARLTRTTTGTNSAAAEFDVLCKTSGNMSDGFGSGILLSIEDATSGIQYIAGIYAHRANGSDTTGNLEFYTRNAGSFGTRGRITYDGNFILDSGYISAGSLKVDNITIDGAVITSDTGAISFSNENLTTTGWFAAANVQLTQGIKHSHSDSAYSYSKPFSKFTNSTPVNGTCVIDLPFAHTNKFMSIKLRGYHYSSTKGPWEVLIGGYNHNADPDRWYSYRASVNGQVPFTQIRLGYNGNTGKCCIMLGATDTAWNYPLIEISDFLSNADGAWQTGWDIAYYTDETNFYNNDATQLDPLTVAWNRDYPAPTEDNQLLASTGDKVAEWTDTLDILKVDNITIDGATITSDTGAISFSNENLSTTGKMVGKNIPSPSTSGKALVSTAVDTATWYTTGLYDVLKQEVPSASGAERKWVLTADSASQFEITPAPWPLTLFANETIYVRTTGNDTTGDGSASFPFLTLEKTVEYLGGLYIGDYTVTIDIGEGTFTEAGTITFMHPFGSQVTFQGVSERIDSQSIASISGTTSYGHDNLYYRNVTIVLPVGKSVAVGNYIGIATVTGGTNPKALLGVHKVSAWVSGTRTATIQVSYCNGSETPSGAITCDIDLIKSVIAFSDKIGIKITGPYFGGVWKGLVIQGDYDGANNARDGIWTLNGAVISISGGDTSGYACGVWGFKVGVYAQNNALIFADYAYISKAGTHICSAQNGGILNLRWARLNAANNSGIYAFNGSTVSANSVQIVGTGDNSVFSYQGSFIDIQNAFVGESASTTSILADRWAAIDGTDATVDDAISPAVDGNNDGSYVIGL